MGGVFGAFINRYANRIEKSRFIGWAKHMVEPNNGPNHLHGTFAKKVYKEGLASWTAAWCCGQ